MTQHNEESNMSATKARKPKTKPAKPTTPKPRQGAFVGETPCEHCGCEWQSHTVNMSTGDMGTACANPYCPVIQQLSALLLLVAKLAADTPQFDNPADVARAK